MKVRISKVFFSQRNFGTFIVKYGVNETGKSTKAEGK